MELSKERKGIEAKFFELCQMIVGQEGRSLYDLEYFPGQKLLRLYIFNEATGTALLQDCIQVDRALSPHFEQAEWVPEHLTLEVSSPGIHRALRERYHFERVVGSEVSLVLSQEVIKIISPNDELIVPKSIKNAKKLNAQLLAVEANGIRLQEEDFEFYVPWSDIVRANLAGGPPTRNVL